MKSATGMGGWKFGVVRPGKTGGCSARIPATSAKPQK